MFSVLYGWDIWLAFLNTVGSAASYLTAGTINQQWISSVYGAVLAHGGSNESALLAHVAVLALVAGLSITVFRQAPAERFWITIGMVAVFASPYLMYYDIVFLLFPMALVIKSVDSPISPGWVYLLFSGEFLVLAFLGFETVSGLGALAFLGFAAALCFAPSRRSRSDSDNFAI